MSIARMVARADAKAAAKAGPRKTRTAGAAKQGAAALAKAAATLSEAEGGLKTEDEARSVLIPDVAAETLRRIETYRAKHGLRSRVEAIRHLIERGLG